MDFGFLHSRIALNVTKRIEIQKIQSKISFQLWLFHPISISLLLVYSWQKKSQVSLPGLQYWDLLQWIKSNKIVSIFHWILNLNSQNDGFLLHKTPPKLIHFHTTPISIRDQVNTSSGPSWCLPNSSRSHSLSLKVQPQAFYERNTSIVGW